MDGVLGRLLRTLDVLKLDRGCLLLGMAVNAHNFAKFAEESVNVTIVELVLRHILNVDREATRVDHLL